MDDLHPLARASQSPSLMINPSLQITLVLTMRVRNQGVREMLVTARKEPELASWLVSLMPQPECASSALTDLDDETLRGLRTLGVVVEEAPRAVFFGDLASATLEAAEDDPDLVRTDYTLTEPGEPLAVEDVDVGAPPLDQTRAHAWVRDAATGILVPSPLSEPERSSARMLLEGGTAAELPAEMRRTLAAKGILERKADLAARERMWQDAWERARTQLRDDGYATLPGIASRHARHVLRDYVRGLQAEGCFPAQDDGGVKGRHGLYDEAGAGVLHAQLAVLFSKLLGESITPSYRYLAVHHAGGALPKHVDREQCAWNCSFVIDMESTLGEVEPWPLFLEVHGRPVPVLLGAGDGVLYRGTEMPHWREELPAGRKVVVCFFHFVASDFQGSRA